MEWAAEIAMFKEREEYRSCNSVTIVKETAMKSQIKPHSGISGFSRIWLVLTSCLVATMLSSLLSSAAFATERETYSLINRLYTYTEFGSGDVAIQMVTAAPVCVTGFWLSPADPGFKTTYALLLSAYFTQTPLRVTGEDTQVWTGSGNVYCRLKFAGTN